MRSVRPARGGDRGAAHGRGRGPRRLTGRRADMPSPLWDDPRMAHASAPAPSFALDGQVALVTGASRGIGRALCSALAAAGADVVVAVRDPADGEAVAAEVSACGRRAHVERLDVTSRRRSTARWRVRWTHSAGSTSSSTTPGSGRRTPPRTSPRRTSTSTLRRQPEGDVLRLAGGRPRDDPRRDRGGSSISARRPASSRCPASRSTA